MELIKNLKINDDAVETWARQVKFFQNSMNDEITEEFIRVMLHEKEINSDEEITKAINNSREGGYSYVLVKRCEALGLKLKNSVAYFLGAKIATTFGECTMLSAYLKYQSHEHDNIQEIDMTFLSTYCFSMGFPNKEEWDKLWDSQKVEINCLKNLRKDNTWASDNILDYKSVYNSLNR